MSEINAISNADRHLPIPFLLPILLFILFFARMAHAQTVNRYDVFEQAFDWQPGSNYASPWDQVTLTMALTSEQNHQFTVDGFYDGGSTWRARFAPPESGNWTWTATITDGSSSQDFNGGFTVNVSNAPGFVRLNPNNSYRWIFDNGASYSPIGVVTGSTPNLDFSMNGDGAVHSLDEYMSTFGQVANFFRWAPADTFSVWNTIDPSGNTYDTNLSQLGDQIVQSAHNHDLRVCAGLFGFSAPFAQGASQAQLDAVMRFARYFVARYGAYVDFWELMNETTADANYYSQITGYIKSIDPYQHPVSTSWSTGDAPGPSASDVSSIDITSPHWYQTESDSDSDFYAAYRLQAWKAGGRPIIVGEQGNYDCVWDSTSAVRMRVRAWTAFFNEGALVLWDESWSQGACTMSGAGNIFLGPEERGYLGMLNSFVSGVSTQLVMTGAMEDSGTLPVSVSTRIRAYGLSAPDMYLAYVTAYADHVNPTSGMQITINPQFSGTATWISPSDGHVLRAQGVPAGDQQIDVPDFTTDVALKIR